MARISIVVNHGSSQIIGNMNPVETAAIRDMCSFKTQGFVFSPQYRAGVWDGRKHLISEKRKVFSTGILDRVIGGLKILDIPCDVIDKRTIGPSEQFMPMREEITLRDYQQASMETAITAQRGTIRIATGGGKTRIGCAIIANLERPAIFLVHRLDLMQQVLGVLRDSMVYPELIGQVGGGVYAPNMITVATVQSLCAVLNIKLEKVEDEPSEPEDLGAIGYAAQILRCLDRCEVVVVDECHHAPASTVFEILTKIKNGIWRIGLSATDWRDDGADLMIEAALGPRIVDISLSDLVDMGWLVPARITMRRMAAPAERFSGKESWNSVYKHFVTDNEAFRQQVAGDAIALAEAGRHVLVLVTAVAHGQILQERIESQGTRAVFLSGRDKVEERTRVLDLIRSGDKIILIATSIADEGLDIPILDALILAGGGKSTTKAYQRIGRVIRKFSDKAYGAVIDYRCHGQSWLEKHAKARLRIYRTESAFKVTEE